MARGPAPQWKQRKEPILDHYIMAAVNARPMDETGAYGTLIVNDLTDAEEKEAFSALRRAALHLKYSVSCVKEDDPEHPGKCQVKFTVRDKAMSRAWIVSNFGTDRSAWKYNPRQRNQKD
jgi:hypothetical protein